MAAQHIPPISWPGNKRKIAPIIIKMMPPHHCYVEPFGGALGVLFMKEPSHREVINDINRDLICFYRVVKYHLQPLLHEIDLQPRSRQIFNEIKSQAGLTDIQRAARWFLRNKFSFDARGEHFSVHVKKAPGAITNFADNIRALNHRLDRVTIECQDWREILRRYDREDTLFFCDPPYTYRDYYNTPWDEQEHLSLRDRLINIKGKFILTYDDSSFIRDIYSGCILQEISQTNFMINIAGAKRGTFKELIITPPK